MTWRWLVAGAFGVGTVAAVALAPALGVVALAGRGVVVERAGWCAPGVCLTGVRMDGVEADFVEARWDRSVRMRGVRVALARARALADGGGADGATGGADAAGLGGLRAAVTRVEVEELVLLDAPVPVPPLSGELWPERSLTGEGVRLVGDEVEATLPTPVGEVSVRARPEGEGVAGEARCAPCRIEAEALDGATVEVPEGVARGTWTDGRVTGVVRAGDIAASVTGTLSPAGGVVRVELDPTPIAALFALVADAVPEVRRARIAGTVAGEIELRLGEPSPGGAAGPPAADPAADPAAEPAADPEEALAEADLLPAGAPTLIGRPQVEGFSVSGVLPPGYAAGPFQWRARDATGAEVLRTGGEGSPSWVPLSEVGPLLPMAIVAAEDASFWSHPGWSLDGMLAAAADNAARGRVWRGGSTLTQQLAKNLFLDGSRTYSRKLRELLYAAEMERTLGKHRILELYVNVVEWGPGIYGAREAAEVYFLKRPEGLLAEEAAWLASILPRPRSAYTSEYTRDRPRMERVRAILDSMRALTDEQREAAKARRLRFVPP